MFCARCGQQIPEASTTCPVCGQETTLKLEPVAAPALAKPSVPYDFVTIPQDLGPKGIGGWLLFYCIVNSIFLPLLVIVPFAFLLRPGRDMRPYLQMLTRNPIYIIDYFRIFCGTAAGIMLWMRHSLAIQLLRIYFIFLATEIVLNLLRVASISLSRHSSIFQSTEIYRTLWSAGFALLWFLYFHKSERVHNTYGRNL